MTLAIVITALAVFLCGASIGILAVLVAGILTVLERHGHHARDPAPRCRRCRPTVTSVSSLVDAPVAHPLLALPAFRLLVRRALDADPRTGQRRWTDRPFLYAGYQDAEIGYAVTDYAAQGRTVHTGLAMITGTEDRQHVYVALSRGTDTNVAYVFTLSPKTADPAPGPRPAPRTGPVRQN